MFNILFGSKKSKPEATDDKPENKVLGNGEATTDDFTFLPPMPSYFNQAIPGAKSPAGAPPGAPSATTIASDTAIDSDNQLNKFSELEGIPFQLSPQCELLIKNSKGVANRSVPFIKKLDLSQFNYDFTKEKSVLRES